MRRLRSPRGSALRRGATWGCVSDSLLQLFICQAPFLPWGLSFFLASMGLAAALSYGLPRSSVGGAFPGLQVLGFASALFCCQMIRPRVLKLFLNNGLPSREAFFSSQLFLEEPLLCVASAFILSVISLGVFFLLHGIERRKNLDEKNIPARSQDYL